MKFWKRRKKDHRRDAEDAEKKQISPLRSLRLCGDPFSLCLRYCLLSFLFPLLLLASPTFKEIEDLSNLPLLGAEFQERKTSKIELGNGVRLLLISDPKADLSAASVAVDAGSWNDPEEYAGMAHFCEHMLFMGTEKYPSENEFFTEISNFGGSANAYTAPHRTVYMFSSQTGGFLSILDRFAHFFIDPIFSPNNIAREMHAVDQEFSKSLEHDGWRAYMVAKETGNPNHPNRMFSCGNSETLSHIPQSALKAWHKANYGGDRISVVIYSSLPLEKIREDAISAFSLVPLAEAPQSLIEGELSSPEQIAHIIYIEPVQNRQTLSFSWELPSNLSSEPSKSASLIAYALGRGNPKSLTEKLKKEGLIDDMTVEVDSSSGPQRRAFQIHFELTQKGIEHIDTVGLYTFQALALFRETGIPSYLFQEKNKIAAISYQYQSRDDAFYTVRKLGEKLPDEPLSTFPREQLIASKYSPKKTAALLSHFTPDKCAITLLAPLSKSHLTPTRKEKWMGAEYTIQETPKSWLSLWNSAKPSPEITLAEPNPFVPTNLRSVKAENTAPTLLSRDKIGLAYYARCSEYDVPEANIHLHILSPEITSQPKSQVLVSLYLDHLTDLLHPTLQAASTANLNATFRLERSRIHINLFGFSEKAPLLLSTILREMPLNPPTKEQFATYWERHKKNYLNAALDLSYKQGKELLDSLLTRDKTTSQQKLHALESLSYEEFLAFHKNLFKKTYLEALFTGNLSQKTAESSWLDIVHALGKSPFPLADHPQTQVLHLTPNGPFSISESTPVQGNASLLVIEQGPFSFEARAVQEILSPPLKEAFFNELRTKQKTGYIVGSADISTEDTLFQLFLVQSNSHAPQDLLYRFELFLEEYLQNFPQNISPDRFETLKDSAIHNLKTKFRSLREKAALYNLLAFEEQGDFHYIDKRLSALASLSYDTFSTHITSLLSRKNHKRLAVLIQGRIPSPFSYEPITPQTLEEVATYSPRAHQDTKL